MKHAVLGLLLVAPVAVHGDQVFLKGGGKVTGVVVEQSAKAVVIEVEAGRVTLPTARVERIVTGPSALADYRRRLLEVPENDAAAWLRLALWADDRGLHTQAREAFARVLTLDPSNATAQRAVGNVLLGARWVTPEESYRAHGYVYFEGAWITPEEREDALRERADRAQAAAAERARAEADARAREAEARARAAEADARRAETQASGYPLSWALAGGRCCFGRLGHSIHVRHFPPATVAPQDAEPAPAPRTRRAGLVTARPSNSH